MIYLPGGTYLMDTSLQLFLGTVIIGDPSNPPVLKASSKFSNDHIVYSKDPNFGGTINFYIGFKNVVIDSTDVDPNRRLTLLDWTVSQATQLTNVVFKMPQGAEGHVGLTTKFDYNSNLILVSTSSKTSMEETRAWLTGWLYRTTWCSKEATSA